MKKNGVAIAPASPALISEVKIRVNKLERDWAAAAEGRGLKNASAVLGEFRAEVAKLQK
jgi:hypothetical protein